MEGASSRDFLNFVVSNQKIKNMSNFIKVEMDNPSDVEFINVDCIVGIADSGSGKHAKLLMSDGKFYTTKCSYSDFLEMLNLSASEL